MVGRYVDAAVMLAHAFKQVKRIGASDQFGLVTRRHDVEGVNNSQSSVLGHQRGIRVIRGERTATRELQVLDDLCLAEVVFRQVWSATQRPPDAVDALHCRYVVGVQRLPQPGLSICDEDPGVRRLESGSPQLQSSSRTSFAVQRTQQIQTSDRGEVLKGARIKEHRPRRFGHRKGTTSAVAGHGRNRGGVSSSRS